MVTAAPLLLRAASAAAGVLPAKAATSAGV
jgi:hypothetical protein